MSGPAVLLIGGSGYVGGAVSQEFLAQKSKFRTIAVLAAPEKVDKFNDVESQGMQVVVGSSTDSSLYQGFDIVISLLGNHGLASQPAIIDAAAAGGVREFYPSEYGADIDVEPYLSTRYFRDKQITRKHLEATAKKITGFGYTYMLNGAITEYLATPFFGVDTEKRTFTFYGKPEMKAAFTSINDIARYIVESTLLPRSSEPERRLKCVGGSYEWQEIIEIIQKVQGVKYDVEYRRLNEAKALQKQAAERGDVNAELGWSLRVILGEPEAVAVPEPWNNDVFAFKPADLATALARQLAE